MQEIVIDGTRMMVRFVGSLDTSNAAEVQERLLANISENDIKSVELDLAGLTYISSAGLRALFKIKQLVYDTRIYNAHMSVYEIFEVAGLTQLMSVNKSDEEISVEGMPLLAKTATGSVYRAEEGVYIKVFDHNYSDEEIEEEIVLWLEAFFSEVGNAITFVVAPCAGATAVRLNGVPEESLVDAIGAALTAGIDGSADFNALMDRYADAAERFGSVEFDDEQLDDVRTVLHGRIDKLADWLTAEETACLRNLADAFKEGYDLVHGDLIPKRFRVLDGELAIMPRTDLCAGSSSYDLYGLARFFDAPSELPADMVQEIYGMDGACIEAVRDAFWKRYFDDLAPEALQERIAKMSLGATLEKYLYLATFTDDKIAERAEFFKAAYLQKVLIPREDEIAELLASL